MREYATVSPRFWTGETGRRLRDAGSNAQLLAMYLITSQHANAIGLYYLPLSYAANDLGLTVEQVTTAMKKVERTGFCGYDPETEVVYVSEMARHQLGASLSPRDRRHRHVVTELMRFEKTPFARAFFDRYQRHYNLNGYVHLTTPLQGPVKGLQTSFFENAQNDDFDETELSPNSAIKTANSQPPTKSLRSQDQDHDQDQDQRSGSGERSSEHDHVRDPSTDRRAPAGARNHGSGEPPGRLTVDKALRAVERRSAGAYVYSAANKGQSIKLQCVLNGGRKFGEEDRWDYQAEATWEAMGEYLAASINHGPVWGTPLLAGCVSDLAAKTQAWVNGGRKPLNGRPQVVGTDVSSGRCTSGAGPER